MNFDVFLGEQAMNIFVGYYLFVGYFYRNTGIEGYPLAKEYMINSSRVIIMGVWLM